MNRSEPTVLWDLPTRLFHWAIVICVPLAWWSIENEQYDLHAWAGYTVLVLVLTRIIWGFIGSRHSRFADFLAGPSTIRNYLQGRGSAGAGHNPLGGWSVMVLLLLLFAQSFSGLFNNDEVLFSGPFNFWADTGWRDAMGVVHELAFDVLLAFIALHIAAVCYYQWHRKLPLVQAMWRGWAPGREGLAAAVPWWRALVVAVVLAVVLWWCVENAPRPALLTW